MTPKWHKNARANFITGDSQRCIECHVEKPLEEFHRARKLSTGRISLCRVCSSERYKARYRERQIAWQREKVTGVTKEQYESALQSQHGRCAICLRHRNEQKNSLAADHCHKTGRFRGCLCDNCNQGLGKFKDDPDLLRKAALYVEGGPGAA